MELGVIRPAELVLRARFAGSVAQMLPQVCLPRWLIRRLRRLARSSRRLSQPTLLTVGRRVALNIGAKVAQDLLRHLYGLQCLARL